MKLKIFKSKKGDEGSSFTMKLLIVIAIVLLLLGFLIMVREKTNLTLATIFRWW